MEFILIFFHRKSINIILSYFYAMKYIFKKEQELVFRPFMLETYAEFLVPVE